ncbi:hypothetical protein Tco_1153280 [Tanacetum coccineum]
MVALPRCDELCQAVSSFDWEPVFILYYHWSMAEDERYGSVIVLNIVSVFSVVNNGKGKEWKFYRIGTLI